MVDGLKMIDAVNAYNKVGDLSDSGKGNTPDFTEMVAEALSATKNNVVVAEKAAIGSITGDVSIEDLAIAVANAETSLRAIVSVRDKIVSAYQDIIRMPI